jgi:WD40 repeat protein
MNVVAYLLNYVEMSNNFSYKVGGSLTEDAPSYVVRQADSDLYNELVVGNFCYIFNSRQMGKTSLQVRTIKRLQAEGIACTTIDVSGRSGKDINPEQWYAGIVYTLVANFKIANPSEFIRTWWKEYRELSPLQRLDIFIEEVLLEALKSKIVIFIDEIDSILSLSFQRDDFFAWIRSCYEKRNLNSEYNRLTFVIIGVATPSDLIEDKVRTPFNIGRAIQLDGFKIHEISPLAEGLTEKVEDTQDILHEVLAWTGGQPFLTQKLCDLLVTSQNSNYTYIENIVKQKIVENWESQDEPPHLKTIKDRILMSKQNTGALLGLYQNILKLGQIAAVDSPEQIELRLSGLVVEQEGYLRVYNRIYATVFDLHWVEKALGNLRPYSEALSAWFASNCQDNSRLLQGLALEEAKNWAANKSLTEQDYQFLAASHELEKQAISTALALQEEESRILAQANNTLTTAQHQAKRQIRIGAGVFICSIIGATIAFTGASKQLQETQEGTKIEQAGVAAIRQFETKQIESLVTAIDAGQRLKGLVQDRPLEKYPATSPLLALQTITDNIREVKQFMPHQEYLTSLNWSHDGKYIITASMDNTARIWDLSGKLITELKGHQGGAYDAKFSPDDKHIITTSWNDRTVRLWNRGGKQLAIFKHQGSITGASFSPDGKRVITTDEESVESTTDGKNYIGSTINHKTVHVWDLSGNLLLQLQHQSRVNSATFSPDSKYILTASNDKTARVWDASGKLLVTLPGHKTGVRSAHWSPDGKYILTLSDNAYLWDISGKQIRKFQVNSEWAFADAGFSPDSKRIFVSNNKKTLVWDLSGRLIREIENQKELNSDAEFSPDGKRIFTIDNAIKVWDIRDKAFKAWHLSGDLITTISGSQRSPRWSPDGKYIVTFGEDRTVRLWDLSDRMPATAILKSQDIMTGVSWSPDSKYIATPTTRSVLIWDRYGKQLAKFIGHSDVVASASFSPNGKRIITASNDKTARVWDTSGKQLLLLSGNDDGLLHAAFSPDGKYILTTTSSDVNMQTKIWSESGKLIATFQGRGITWSPNSKYIMAMYNSNGNNYSSLWDISGKKIIEFKASKNSYFGASFSADGERIVTTEGETASIWNTSGQKLSEFKANKKIYNASFSLDGTRFITASPDNKIIIWNTSGEQIIEIPHPDTVSYGKFSPDGERIVTVSNDKIRIWDISGRLLAEYKYFSQFVSLVNFSPDGKYILAQISAQFPDVLIWRLDELDRLLTRGCEWLKDYLSTQPQIRERLKVCSGK